MVKNSMFKIIENRGFHIRFKNGITASVQFGPGNYCNNKFNHKLDNYMDNFTKPAKSIDAEVAAWDLEGKWVTKKVLILSEDDVVGYLDSEEVLDFLNKCRNYKKVLK